MINYDIGTLFDISEYEVKPEKSKEQIIERNAKVKKENNTPSISVNTNTNPVAIYHSDIEQLLKQGVESVLEITETLIKEKQASNERYITDKPRLYPWVCIYIEEHFLKTKKCKLLRKTIEDIQIQYHDHAIDISGGSL